MKIYIKNEINRLELNLTLEKHRGDKEGIKYIQGQIFALKDILKQMRNE